MSRMFSGSLVARVVFQPVEETSRIFFSHALADTPSSTSKGPSWQSLQSASSVLLSILAVQCSSAVLLLVFGLAYMPIAVYILLPSQYITTSAPEILTAWVWYIPVLAVNGVLEAFLSSVSDTRNLNKQSRFVERHPGTQRDVDAGFVHLFSDG
jgi:oligosaccharide translocation protein RFT1